MTKKTCTQCCGGGETSHEHSELTTVNPAKEIVEVVKVEFDTSDADSSDVSKIIDIPNSPKKRWISKLHGKDIDNFNKTLETLDQLKPDLSNYNIISYSKEEMDKYFNCDTGISHSSNLIYTYEDQEDFVERYSRNKEEQELSELCFGYTNLLISGLKVYNPTTEDGMAARKLAIEKHNVFISKHPRHAFDISAQKQRLNLMRELECLIVYHTKNFDINKKKCMLSQLDGFSCYSYCFGDVNLDILANYLYQFDLSVEEKSTIKSFATADNDEIYQSVKDIIEKRAWKTDNVTESTSPSVVKRSEVYKKHASTLSYSTLEKRLNIQKLKNETIVKLTSAKNVDEVHTIEKNLYSIDGIFNRLLVELRHLDPVERAEVGRTLSNFQSEMRLNFNEKLDALEPNKIKESTLFSQATLSEEEKQLNLEFKNTSDIQKFSNLKSLLKITKELFTNEFERVIGHGEQLVKFTDGYVPNSLNIKTDGYGVNITKEGVFKIESTDISKSDLDRWQKDFNINKVNLVGGLSIKEIVDLKYAHLLEQLKDENNSNNKEILKDLYKINIWYIDYYDIKENKVDELSKLFDGKVPSEFSDSELNEIERKIKENSAIDSRVDLEDKLKAYKKLKTLSSKY